MESSLAGTFKEIPLELLRPNEWNPNEMTDDEFGMLVEEVSSTGMITILQVTPCIDDKGDQYFRIIGGEHRYRALKILGHAMAPCVVLEGEQWSDEDLQRFKTVRLNIIHGNNNPEKFMELYLDVAERHHGADLQAEFGFTSDDAWKALVKQVTDGAADALPDKAKKKLKKAVQKLDGKQKTVEGLHKVLQQIMDEYGSTVEQRFVYFELGGKKHLHVNVTEPTFALIEAWMKDNVGPDLSADDAFAALLQAHNDTAG